MIANLKEAASDRDTRIATIETRSTIKDNIQEIVDNHQRFFEQSEVYQRKKNVVVTGLDETGSEESDIASITTVLEALDVQIAPEKVCRLGKPPLAVEPAANNGQGPRKRPILVTLKSSDECKELLAKAKSLKDNVNLKNVFIKSDKPPHERKEWQRLRQVCKTEKSRPANAGMNVRVDYRKRCVMVGDRVIEKGNFHHGPGL